MQWGGEPLLMAWDRKAARESRSPHGGKPSPPHCTVDLSDFYDQLPTRAMNGAVLVTSKSLGEAGVRPFLGSLMAQYVDRAGMHWSGVVAALHQRGVRRMAAQVGRANRFKSENIDC